VAVGFYAKWEGGWGGLGIFVMGAKPKIISLGMVIQNTPPFAIEENINMSQGA